MQTSTSLPFFTAIIVAFSGTLAEELMIFCRRVRTELYTRFVSLSYVGKFMKEGHRCTINARSSVSISSESNLDERHVVVLVLWSCLQLWPENDVSIDPYRWFRNLFGISNFLGFQGSWVERDFTQLVTAVFQGICEANPGWKCVGLQLLWPVLHWRNVESSKLTDNTENGQRNSPLPYVSPHPES